MAAVIWRPGMRITADRLRSMTPQAPDTWEVEWTTTSGSNIPSFGSADITAQYAYFGRMCMCRLEILFASDTDFGGGGTGDNWIFSVPVEAAETSLISGFGEISNGSIGNRLGVRVRLSDANHLVLNTSTGRVDATALTSPNWGVLDAATPWTWSTSASIYAVFWYATAE